MSKSKVKSFAVGDRVSWESQAGGYSKKKIGTVVEVVPASHFPQMMGGVGGLRHHESYVVSVIHSPTTKPERYWPLVRNLRLVKRGGASASAAAARPHPTGVTDPAPESAEPAETDVLRFSTGASVTVDRDSFTDVKLVEHGPNTEQMLAQDVQDAERAIANVESAN